MKKLLSLIILMAFVSRSPAPVAMNSTNGVGYGSTRFQNVTATIFNGSGAGLSNAAPATLAATLTNSTSTTGTNTMQARTYGITNANVFVGDGGIQLSTVDYGQLNVGDDNQRSGIEFREHGWDGIPWRYNDYANVADAGIKTYYRWGGGVDLPTLHVFSKGSIRIEGSFAGLSARGISYISFANEDSNDIIYVNYSTFSTYLSGSEQSNRNGYGLPLTFASKGRISGNSFFGLAAIQGVFSGNNGDVGFDSSRLAELRFLSRRPYPDTTNATFGVMQPTYEHENGRMSTNGWRFYGPVNYEVQDYISDTSTNVVLDFNKNSGATIRLYAFSGTSGTNLISTTNLNVYVGSTNLETRVYRFLSGGLDRPLSWPSTWSVVSESGTATLPTLLSASNVLILSLSLFGDGLTNVVAQFGVGVDKSFQYDTAATTFFTTSGISNIATKGAVDYLVRAMKATNNSAGASLWSKSTALYPFADTNAGGNAINLKSPGTYTITWTATVTHSVNGITGDGATGYGATGFTQNNAGADTNAHFVLYCRTTSPTGVNLGGSRNNSTTATFGLRTSGANLAAHGPMNANTPTTLLNVSTDFRGILAVSRVDSNVYYGMSRSAISTNSAASTGSMSVGHDVLARAFGDGSHTGQTTANLAFCSIGDGLNPDELFAFRNIINNFETLMGRQVP